MHIRDGRLCKDSRPYIHGCTPRILLRHTPWTLQQFMARTLRTTRHATCRALHTMEHTFPGNLENPIALLTKTCISMARMRGRTPLNTRIRSCQWAACNNRHTPLNHTMWEIRQHMARTLRATTHTKGKMPDTMEHTPTMSGRMILVTATTFLRRKWIASTAGRSLSAMLRWTHSAISVTHRTPQWIRKGQLMLITRITIH